MDLCLNNYPTFAPDQARLVLATDDGENKLSWSAKPFVTSVPSFPPEWKYNPNKTTNSWEDCPLIIEYWYDLREREDALFAIYSQIWALIKSWDFDVAALEQLKGSTVTVFAKLRRKVRELYRLHTTDEAVDAANSMQFWLARKGLIPQDPIQSDLAVLSFALQPMLPIWGELIERTRKVVGGTFKEYLVYSLLKDSELAASPQLARVRRFVRDSIDQWPQKLPSMVADSTVEEVEEAPLDDWLEASFLVRRLPLAHLRPHENVQAESLSAYSQRYLMSRMSMAVMEPVTKKKPTAEATS